MIAARLQLAGGRKELGYQGLLGMTVPWREGRAFGEKNLAGAAFAWLAPPGHRQGSGNHFR